MPMNGSVVPAIPAVEAIQTTTASNTIFHTVFIKQRYTFVSDYHPGNYNNYNNFNGNGNPLGYFKSFILYI